MATMASRMTAVVAFLAMVMFCTIQHSIQATDCQTVFVLLITVEVGCI